VWVELGQLVVSEVEEAQLRGVKKGLSVDGLDLGGGGG